MSSGGPPSARKALLVVCMAALLGVLVIVHMPGVNGPWYWHWPWRRLEALHVYLPLLLAAVPFFFGQWVHARSRRRLLPALVLVMLSLFAMQVVASGVQERPFGLGRIVEIVQSPGATSYFTDAARLSGGEVTARPGWLAGFPDLLPHFHLHSKTKPPGPILYHLAFIHHLGPTREAALWGGLLIGLLATLSIPATYSLIRALGGRRSAAFHGASFFALTPGLVLFFPEFDQIYPALAAVMIAAWATAVQWARYAPAAAFGVCLALAVFFTYAFLVLGAFLAGLTGVRVVEGRIDLGRAAKLLALALVVVAALYLALWSLTGFDPLGTFWGALRSQAMLNIERPYPYTVFFDLTDFALGAGWIAAVLLWFAVRRLWRNRPASTPRLRILLLCLAQLVIVALTGLLPGETARVWLFLMPLLMLPVGLELARWEPRHRVTAYGALWFLTSAICQNMTFIVP